MWFLTVSQWERYRSILTPSHRSDTHTHTLKSCWCLGYTVTPGRLGPRTNHSQSQTHQLHHHNLEAGKIYRQQREADGDWDYRAEYCVATSTVCLWESVDLPSWLTIQGRKRCTELPCVYPANVPPGVSGTLPSVSVFILMSYPPK